MATDIEQVRVLIPDTEDVFDGETLFTDDDIQTYLDIAAGSVLRGAAYAILAIANSEAMISKVIRTQDLQTDGAKVADSMRKTADTLLARADKQDDLAGGFYIDIVDYTEGWSSDNPELTEWNWS